MISLSWPVQTGPRAAASLGLRLKILRLVARSEEKLHRSCSVLNYIECNVSVIFWAMFAAKAREILRAVGFPAACWIVQKKGLVMNALRISGALSQILQNLLRRLYSGNRTRRLPLQGQLSGRSPKKEIASTLTNT
jgi:hypothetical protein